MSYLAYICLFLPVLLEVNSKNELFIVSIIYLHFPFWNCWRLPFSPRIRILVQGKICNVRDDKVMAFSLPTMKYAHSSVEIHKQRHRILDPMSCSSSQPSQSLSGQVHVFSCVVFTQRRSEWLSVALAYLAIKRQSHNCLLCWITILIMWVWKRLLLPSFFIISAGPNPPFIAC